MNSSATLTGCDDIIRRLREAIAEHPLSPIHGYAADIAALLDRLDAAERSADWHRKRCDLLQQWQAKMRDPERTLVCDILANGAVLPDQNGRRYGSSAIDAAMAAEQPESAE